MIVLKFQLMRYAGVHFLVSPPEFLTEINGQVASNCSNLDFGPVRTMEDRPKSKFEQFESGPKSNFEQLEVT